MNNMDILTNDLLRYIIETFTEESGVRNLEKAIHEILSTPLAITVENALMPSSPIEFSWSARISRFARAPEAMTFEKAYVCWSPRNRRRRCV